MEKILCKVLVGLMITWADTGSVVAKLRKTHPLLAGTSSTEIIIQIYYSHTKHFL